MSSHINANTLIKKKKDYMRNITCVFKIRLIPRINHICKNVELMRVDGNVAPHLLTQVEINHAYGLLGMVIFVVLQHVWVASQTATAKNKPSLLPCLQGEYRNEAKGYFVCSNNDCSIPG